MNLIKILKWFFVDQFMFHVGGGGGGGQPGPTQSTSYSTNLPEYARPYVETMLGATQQQLFTMDGTGVTGFSPYNPYSTNVNDYVAGFSPLQQQAQSAAANLQTPDQYGRATNMTNRAGVGSLGLAGQMAGAGQNYAQQATNPYAIQSYMSPYMQNVVDYQKSQAVRDYGMSQGARKAQAVGQGAFGGNRQALMESEAQRGLMSQLGGIEAQGAQSAFQNAQQAQQFGANLGLQGQQGALQGLGQYGQMAGQLGQLGTAQLAAQQGILNTQNQMGAAQQAQEQTKINQAIQDYAIQQQYPLMQLGFMSNMLRGLPMQSQTTQLYQAQPSSMQQGIGLLGAGASLIGAGKAGGGEIKEMAEGGIAGYKYGGAIPGAKLEGMADNLSVPQLVELLKDPQLDEGERQAFRDALASKQQTKARSEGIAAAGGGLFNTMGYAGGGILAFAGEDGSDVKDPDELINQINLVGSQLDAINKEASAVNAPGSKQRAFAPEKVAEFENLKKRQDELKGEYATLMSKAGVDKPAIGYNSGLAPNTLTPNPFVQKLGEQTPEAQAPARPTAGEFAAFDDATARYLAEQEVKNKPTETANTPGTPSRPGTPSGGGLGSGIDSILAGLKKAGPKGEYGADGIKSIDERLAGADKRMSRAEQIAMAKAFAKFGTTADPTGGGVAAVKGLETYADEYGKAIESDEKYRADLITQKNDIEKLRRAEERGDVKLAAELQDKIADRANRLQQAQISASSAGATQRNEQAKIDRLMQENPGMSYKDALQFVAGAGRMESNDITAIKAAIAGYQNSLYTPGVSKEDKAKIQQEIARLNQQLITIGTGNLARSGGGGGGNIDANNPLLKG